MDDKKCYKPDFNNQCCCNCNNQIELRKHPGNNDFGKGSIMEKCGYVCVAKFDMDENYKTGIFFDSVHGMCEMWQPIKQKS